MLTATQLSQVGNFDESTINNLREALGGGVQALAAPGAVNVSTYVTELSVDGTDAFTLAAPTIAGQRKRIVCVAAANTPAGTLTVSSPDTTTGFVCPATFFFDTVGQALEFRATAGLKWRCIKVDRTGGTADNVVVGTTAITNKLWRTYALSITGSVASTLPNGAAVGEQIQVICTTVALGGAGTLDGAFFGGAALAYTHLGAFGVVASTTVVGDCALLEWDGTAWKVLFQNGTTLS
jgi:hypothetical protein